MESEHKGGVTPGVKEGEYGEGIRDFVAKSGCALAWSGIVPVIGVVLKLSEAVELGGEPGISTRGSTT